MNKNKMLIEKPVSLVLLGADIAAFLLAYIFAHLSLDLLSVLMEGHIEFFRHCFGNPEAVFS